MIKLLYEGLIEYLPTCESTVILNGECVTMDYKNKLSRD